MTDEHPARVRGRPGLDYEEVKREFEKRWPPELTLPPLRRPVGTQLINGVLVNKPSMLRYRKRR